ncbi:MAG: C_GCAxxG_C_C family protein [Ruminococcaceae bacterium]|nr:C_GCAxxG_C_C family protein [Oscillospiraceae bacterium]
MKNHSEKAAELFVSGCNCSQAVFGAFAEDCGIDFETALKLSSSFGGGMGRLRETCGAVTGMFMVAGLLKGYSDTDDKDAKDNHYKLIQELANEFKAVYQTYNCNELLGNIGKGTYISAPRTAEYYKTRPCVNFVVTAAEILDKRFFTE